MKNFKDPKGLIAELSSQLSEARLAEVRGMSGIGYLPPGALTELVKDEPFCMEDIVTVLLSGWVLQTGQIKAHEERIAELEGLCNAQQKSIDGIADQATRLRFLLGSILPDGDVVSPVDMLKKIAARGDGTAKT